MNGRVEEVDVEEMWEVLLSSAAKDQLVMVDFYATWCGPCRMIAPRIEQLSLQYTDVIFLKVDVDKLRNIAQRYGVSAMPTFIFFKNGEKVHQFSGANPAKIEEALRSFSSTTANTINNNNNPVSNPQAPTYKYFPQTSYVVYDSGKLDMILDKILQFNSKFTGDVKNQMNNADQVNFKKLVNTLKNTSMYHSSKFTAEEFSVLLKIIQWPISERFPALDVLRLMVLHPEAASYFGKATNVTEIVLGYLKETNAPFANHLMCLRFLCNGFRWIQMRDNIMKNILNLLSILEVHIRSDNVNIRNACVTVLLNISAYYTNEEDLTKSQSDAPKRCAGLLFEHLRVEKEEEAIFRNICAMGTLAGIDVQVRQGFSTVKGFFDTIQSQSQKITDAINDLKSLLDYQGGSIKPTVTPAKPLMPPGSSNTGGLPGMGGMGSGGFPGMGGGFPGMGGGFPGMGGMPQLPPDMMQKIMSNPDLMRAMQNPAIMAKLQQMMSDPSSLSMYQNDPEIMDLFQKMQSLF